MARNWPEPTRDAPYDLADEFGAAYARFPYPESFFVWKARTVSRGAAAFFNRAERPPAWQARVESGVAYPVLITEEPAGASGVIDAVRRGATPRRPFVIQEVTLGHAPYQVVAHALYAGPDGADLADRSAIVQVTRERHRQRDQLLGRRPDARGLGAHGGGGGPPRDWRLIQVVT